MSARDLSRRALVSGGVLALVYAPAWLIACSDAGGDTTGERVRLNFEVRSVALDEFPNGFGWNVRVDRVLVGGGPLYLFQGAPLALLRGLLGVRTAHAHPGHYDEGEALGEWLAPFTADLLAGDTALGVSDGVSGEARSARFTFAQLNQQFTRGLAGAAVRVEGSARDASANVLPFVASATLSELAGDSGDARVDGCVLEGGPIDADGQVSLEIDPRLWLDQVDFEGASDAGLAERGQRGFIRGLLKAAAYRFKYSRG